MAQSVAFEYLHVHGSSKSAESIREHAGRRAAQARHTDLRGLRGRQGAVRAPDTKRSTISWLYQVPAIPVDIFEHRNSPVRFIPRFLAKLDALCTKGVVVTPKVVSVEKQEDTPTGLVSDTRYLTC